MALVFFIALCRVIDVVVAMQQLAVQQHYGAITMIFAEIVGDSGFLRGPRSIWMHDRRITYVEKQLSGSYFVHFCFWQHTRLLPQTFEYLSSVLALSLSPSDRCVRSSIPLRTQVAMSLIDYQVEIRCASLEKNIWYCREHHFRHCWGILYGSRKTLETFGD